MAQRDREYNWGEQRGGYGGQSRYGQQGGFESSGYGDYGRGSEGRSYRGDDRERDEYKRDRQNEGEYGRGRSAQFRGTSRGDYGESYGGEYGSSRPDNDRGYDTGSESRYYGGGGLYGGGMGGYTGGGYMGGGLQRSAMGGEQDYGYGRSGYGSSAYGSRGYEGRGEEGRSSGYGDRERRGGREEEGWWDRVSNEVSSWFGGDEAQGDRGRSHRGRGPKNYIRSDDRIREDINDRLTDDYSLDASEIEVVVSGGDVTLTGTVESRHEKRRAEDIAEDISGVHNVENRIRVNRGYSTQSSMNTSTQSNTAATTNTTGTAGTMGATESTTSRGRGKSAGTT